MKDQVSRDHWTSSVYRNPAFDYLRLALVLIIFFYHLDLVHWGYLAVDIFIILSGYLSAERLGADGNVKYLLGRFKRIFVPLMVMFSIALALREAFWSNYFSLFSQSAFQTLLGVYETRIGRLANLNYFDVTSFYPGIYLWSLSVEIKCWLLLSAAIFLKRTGLIAITILLFLYYPVTSSVSEVVGYMDFHWRASQFFIGVILSLTSTSIRRDCHITLSIGILLIASLFLNVWHYGILNFLATMVGLFVIVLCKKNSAVESPKYLVLLSNGSYHFFLVHGVGIALASVGLVYVGTSNALFIIFSAFFSVLLATGLFMLCSLRPLYLAIIFLVAVAAYFWRPFPVELSKYDGLEYGGNYTDDAARLNSPGCQFYAYGDSHAGMLRYGMHQIGKCNFIVLSSDSQLPSIPPESIVFISFRWIGFDKWIKNHGIDDSSVDSIAKGYARWLQMILHINNWDVERNIFIIGQYPQLSKFLPAPLGRDCVKVERDFPLLADEAEKFQMFNDILKKEVQKIGYNFIDPFSHLTRSNGKILNECLYSDNNHLSTYGSLTVSNGILQEVDRFLSDHK